MIFESSSGLSLGELLHMERKGEASLESPRNKKDSLNVNNAEHDPQLGGKLVLNADTRVEGHFEEEHVQQVYEAIAPHFSATRYKRWPIVDKFIKSIPKGSFGCDFGCGNGKNLENDPSGNIVTIGMDACSGLVEICKGKGFEVSLGTILKDPFRSEVFDFTLSIAVIHHLRTSSRRLQSIKEMIRVMRKGAKGLIFVWAFEENKSVRRHKLTVLNGNEQDVLVPWSLSEFKDSRKEVNANNEPKRSKIHEELQQDAYESELFQRYYHLFKRGELDDLIVEAGGRILESDYDRDNYYIIFEK